MKNDPTIRPTKHWEFTRFVIFVYFAVFATMLGLYAGMFGLNMSDQHERWGQFGDFMGGILNPLTSLFTLFVAILVWKLQSTELTETRAALQEQNRLNSLVVADQTLARYFDALETSIKAVHVHIRSTGQSGDTQRDLVSTAAVGELVGWLKGKGLLFWQNSPHEKNEHVAVVNLAIERFSPIRSAVKATTKYIESTYSNDALHTKYELLRIRLSSETKMALCYLIWLEDDAELLRLVRLSKLMSDFPTEKIRTWITEYQMPSEH